MTSKSDIRVLSQDYHRNGIGGASFIVSLVSWPSAARDMGYPDSFVAVSFTEEEFLDRPKGTYTPRTRREYMREHTAVLNIPNLEEGNIEQGWRGADYVGEAVTDAWHTRQVGLGTYDPFGCGHVEEEVTA